MYEAANTLIAGYDTAWTQRCRAEERGWRHEDVQFRNVFVWPSKEQTAEFWQEKQQWRAEDLEQRVLDNARALWDRTVEKNRRDVEERALQLKGISTVGGLVSGLAMTSFWNFQAGDQAAVPYPAALDFAYGTTTAAVAVLFLLPMVICAFMHASILKTATTYVNLEAEADFLYRCRDFAVKYRVGARPPAPSRTFAAHWTQRCERGWQLAFYLFSAGIPMFMINMALSSYIRFWSQEKAVATSMTAVLACGIAAFAYVYGMWSGHLVGPQTAALVYVASSVGLPFDYHLASRHPPRRPSTLRSTHQRPPRSAAHARRFHSGAGNGLDDNNDIGTELHGAAATVAAEHSARDATAESHNYVSQPASLSDAAGTSSEVPVRRYRAAAVEAALASSPTDQLPSHS